MGFSYILLSAEKRVEPEWGGVSLAVSCHPPELTNLSLFPSNFYMPRMSLDT